MIHTTLLEHIIAGARGTDRYIVGLAGPPGAGKSTAADALRAALTDTGFKPKVVPMDGFHLDNDTLDSRGLRARKGAPDTFDAAGFVALVKKLRNAEAPQPFPTFDRENDCVVPDADTVDAAHDVLLVEGNYLLLNTPPWQELSGVFDLTVLLNPGLPTLETRLIDRWVALGLSQRDAVERAQSNDIPNAHCVLAQSTEPDWVIDSNGE